MRIFTKGTCTFDGQEYNAFAISNSSSQIEIFLTDLYAHIESSYKFDGQDEYSFNNNQSKEVWKFIKNGISKCTTKSLSLVPIEGLGTVKRYSVNKGKSNWSIDKYDGQFCGIEAFGVTNEGKQVEIYLEKCDSFDVQDIPYIKLTNFINNTVKNSLQTGFENIDDFEETIPVRSLAEIGLEKDITWLNNKKYYIVNDEAQAEMIFKYLENYNGIISYDTETTGLCINMFGEIGSERKKFIDNENERLKAEGKPIYKVDKLVGIIFCVEKDVSYYFPCGNRKFKNIYSDVNDKNTQMVAENILARYTVGDLRDAKTSMANYIRNTPIREWTSDVILMERVRDILEKKWIGTHHGSFEYKVDLMYSIDTNLKDDSMLLHQLLFKFRSTTSNRGEPSNLKYLTKVEFGIDQLDLKDFFVSYTEDASGLARQNGKKKKKSSNIDFSYMDYDGAKAYAPADGDFTLGLIVKYKTELNTPELKSQEYLYTVEVLVSCAIGYMEYYGHRLDENKIESTKINTYSEMLLIEKKIRDFINANTEEELEGFKKIEDLQNKLSDIEKSLSEPNLTKESQIIFQEQYDKVLKELDDTNMEVRYMIDTSVNLLNLGSSPQVCELFYEKLNIPAADKAKPSVAKRAIKPLSQAKDENNKLKYPVVKLYMDWKNCNTLLTKFFDNLPAYSYPGGFIFSSYGQISTATGRMSCSKPNAQQYPHSVTKMVIPRNGFVFADADYSQIEYRTLTAMAKEPALMDKFKDPDMDYHTTMASLMYDVPYANVTGSMRSEAKTFNFGIPYGMGLKKLAFQLKGSESPEAIADAQVKYDLYFKEQPNVKKFFDDVKEGARIYGYTRTKWGRRRYYSFTDENGKLDTRKMGAALRQAGNACIQGTAADIFKIGVARNFLFIRDNKLFGKYIITNMVHDEQLVEISCELNVKTILANLIKAMELHIDGFPPLFVGAGIGESWDEAKGKMAEIHPVLGKTFVQEVDEANDGLYAVNPMIPEEVYKYFNKRNYEFRENKILDYVLDESNYGQALHPVIGSLLGLQFDYGVSKELKEKFPKDGEGILYTKEEREEAELKSPLERLRRFIEAHHLDIDVNNFVSNTVINFEDEISDEYVDEMDEDMDDLDIDLSDDGETGISAAFKLIDESTEYFGCSLKDLIKTMGIVVSHKQRIVGINWNGLTFGSQQRLSKYLNKHLCTQDEAGAYRVMLLNNTGQLMPKPDQPQMFINNISENYLSDSVEIS